MCSTDSNAELLKCLLSCQGLFLGYFDRAALTVAPAKQILISQQSYVAQASHCFLPAASFRFFTPLAVMAPKTAAAADKKPAPAKKAVAKKSTGGRKKGSKKAVESYKIYIYKVCSVAALKQVKLLSVYLASAPCWSTRSAPDLSLWCRS